MENYGKLITPSTLQFERTLEGPITRVWEYLVDGSKRALWFAGGPTDLVPEGKMELVFNNSKFSTIPEPTPEKYKDVGDGFTSVAIIKQIEEPHRLVIHWEEGIVTFELEELDNERVKLTLTHEKLKSEKDYRVGVMAGWHTHLDILVDRLSNHEVKGFWSVHMRLEGEYDQMID